MPLYHVYRMRSIIHSLEPSVSAWHFPRVLVRPLANSAWLFPAFLCSPRMLTFLSQSQFLVEQLFPTIIAVHPILAVCGQDIFLCLCTQVGSNPVTAGIYTLELRTHTKGPQEKEQSQSHSHFLECLLSVPMFFYSSILFIFTVHVFPFSLLAPPLYLVCFSFFTRDDCRFFSIHSLIVFFCLWRVFP